MYEESFSQKVNFIENLTMNEYFFKFGNSQQLSGNLTAIGGPWYFDRAVVFQRLINQSCYQEILLLQKFNDLLGKVLKPKKIQPPTSKK